MKKGTPAHRQESMKSLIATKVSVVEPSATPFTSWYPVYWPRTQSEGSTGRMDSKACSCWEWIAAGVALDGGSIESRPMICMMWFWTTSFRAPTRS